MKLKSALSLTDVCQELGLSPQFLMELAESAVGMYCVFDQPKRSGGLRTISSPRGQLKITQRVILDGLLARFPMPAHVHGCVKGRSIVSNARAHADREIVINIDLQDFFGTVSFDIVKKVFQNQFNCDPEAAEALARITTYHNRLPQGAPSSPALANCAALTLDQELIALVRACIEGPDETGFGYSRYVDDITISGTRALLNILPQVFEVIEKNGFRTNMKKTRILRQSTRQWVTGVVVNKKVNPPKKLVRKVRQQLYYCKKYGFMEHCERRDLKPFLFLARLSGLVGYIRMTQPEVGLKFARLLTEVAPSTKLSKEEETLMLLKKIIDYERLATFSCDYTRRRVVPADIIVDDEGHIFLRAFQLSPEQGWLSFALQDIHGLKMERNNLS